MTLQSGRAWCLGGGLVKAPAVTDCNQGTDARAMVGPGRTLDDARLSAHRPVLAPSSVLPVVLQCPALERPVEQLPGR